MNKEVEHSIQHAFTSLMYDVWQGVAKETIAKKLSLTAARL